MSGGFTDHSHPAVASSLQILSRMNRTHTFFSSINWSAGTPPWSQLIWVGEKCWRSRVRKRVWVTCSFSLVVAGSQSYRGSGLLLCSSSCMVWVNQMTSVHDGWFRLFLCSHLRSMVTCSILPGSRSKSGAAFQRKRNKMLLAEEDMSLFPNQGSCCNSLWELT